ncbi:MAG: DUF1080 domain-containing protein [Phycisphaerae bacterium]|nr:DUF1080 domain-containing protein [Phycisphaerae bacterium]
MNSRQVTVWILAVLLAALAAPGLWAAEADAPKAYDLKPIFDGKTLDGWKALGQGKFTVDEGTILGQTGNGGWGWLCTKKIYGDFVLEMDVKMEQRGNSGVQIRSHMIDGKKMVGCQIDIDGGPGRTGSLYEQGRRGWLQQLKGDSPAGKAFKFGQWNRLRIDCIGDSIKTWVNKVPCADYVDSLDIDGIIALQVHSGKGVRLRWKNIRIADLGRRTWKPILDPKTLKGWKVIGPGKWQASEGAVVGTHKASEGGHGHVISDKLYDDFTIRFQFKSVKGNSGFYFRVEKGGGAGVKGFQAEVDPAKDVGGLYETDGRAWVVKPTPAAVKKFFRPQKWNTMTVSARGRRIVVKVNGRQTASLTNDRGRLKGHLAIQLHGGQDVEVAFKNMEILSEAKKQ